MSSTSSSTPTKSKEPEADYGPAAPITPSTPSSSASSSSQERFLYFAYGSNLLPSQLALKTVSVHSSRPGYIEDVALLFDLSYSSLVEPCYANLQRNNIGKRVHGVVYELDAKDMLTMDRNEGSGRSYVREEFLVKLYHEGSAIHPEDKHEIVKAHAYICHPNNLSKVVLKVSKPSHRYLTVLLRGAQHHKLDSEYIEWLKAHPFTPLPELKFTPEQHAAVEGRTITQAELEAHCWRKEYDDLPIAEWKYPLFLALKGIVFDIRAGKFSNAWKANNAGKDLTIFCAGRVPPDDSHTIPRSIEELNEEHKRYINATLVDYANMYEIAGHMSDRAKYDF